MENLEIIVAEHSHYWRNNSHYVRSFINFVCAQLKNTMAKKQLNRLKVVLAEKNKTGIWLSQQLGKDRTTVSKWCSNAVQPSHLQQTDLKLMKKEDR